MNTTVFRAGFAAIAMALTAVLVVAPSVRADTEAIAVLVVSNGSSPVTPDRVVRDRLVSLGYDVDLVDDGAASAADAVGADVVVITTTASASKVGNAFTEVDTPVLAWEPQLFDELGFHPTSESGQTRSTSIGRIVDASHPIAGGLSGDVTVTTSNAPLTWARPVGDVDVVAVEPFNSARPVLFAYDVGAQMHEMVAPARRVGSFGTWSSPTRWSDDGAALFDSAVAWLTSGPPPVNAAPTADAGEDRTVAPGVSVVLDGVVDDDGRPSGELSISWAAGEGVSFDDESSLTPAASFPGIGIYELTLTVDDGDLTASDTVVITVSNDAPPPPPEVLWVTSGPSAPSVETPGIERLEAAGSVVTVVDDDQVDVGDAAGMDLVIITSRVNPSRVKATFVDVAIPVMVWEAYLYDDMGFAVGNGARGQVGGQRSIRVVDDGPLAAGFSGVVSVLTKGQTMSFAVPAGDAQIIARVPSSSTRATVFAYEAGAMMHAVPAPARRLGYFLAGGGPKAHNDNGWAMWDAAIEWLLTDDAAEAVLSASASVVEVDETVSFDGSASTASDEIVSYDWDLGDGSSATGESVDHAYATPGSQTVTLTIVDAAGRTSSASIDITVVTSSAGWQGGTRPFRASVNVAAGVHDRSGSVATVDLDVAELVAGIDGAEATINPDSIMLVRVDAPGGSVLDHDVAFQFDAPFDADPGPLTSGELVIGLGSDFAAGTSQTFDLYFDDADSGGYVTPSVEDRVVTASVTDEQRAATRFATASGDWYFDMEGGGFSSLDDIDGRDWIGWSTASRGDGEFRGIPNAVFPEGWFHPGSSGMVSELVGDGPLRATIESTSPDGQYLTRWHVYSDHAEMEMVRAGGEYWFLYEGTPGGSFNGNHDRVWRPDGTSIRAKEAFSGDLVEEEWVYFSDPFVDRSLMVAHVEDDALADRYFSLSGDMTVFGFGRGEDLVPRLTEPERFVVGLIEGLEFDATASTIRAHLAPLVSTIEPATVNDT